MSEGVHHAVAPGDADATVVLPTAGRRPGQFRFAPSLDRHATAADLAALGGLNPLVEAANPILGAVPQLRHSLRHPDPVGLRARLRAQLEDFERAALAAGVAEDRRFVARYALCALLDDAAGATPWGRDWLAGGLSAEVHGATAGADKFFALLDPMLAQPRVYQDLLELFYVCLALGFEGKYRGGEGGRLALSQIRTRLYAIIAARRPPADELSARWRGAEIRSPRDWLALIRAKIDWATRGAKPPAEAAVPEVALLQQRFAETAGVVRRARFVGADGRRRALSQLPWYLVIGAPGSGKTTALLHAGLRFPLGDEPGEATLHRSGGTRNCDWWLTDDAVLLDTAGRYTTDDVDADRAAWLGVLDLLKLHRPKQPLNGVIAALSVYDLLHWTDEEIVRYAGQMRERVAELQARLGMRVPIYLVVTKADLLAGFGEFFSAFDPEQRAQVWGVTFDRSEVHAEPGQLVRRFDEEFDHLERRLYAALPARLQEERDLQRRGAIYRFPQQLRGARPLIATFIDAAFGSGWSGERPLLRGIYLASATQEGSPIDRVLATLSRSYNLERKVQPPNVGTGKSFFLRRLLREVVFGEAGLAGGDRR
ncbi:MAG: type secretion system protein ImpL [Betaproteobacteria bacterium]|nr:type secretion system protein ImpL [Betaproteobacteria bacterium]